MNSEIKIHIDKTALSSNTIKATVSFGTPETLAKFQKVQIITYINGKKVAEGNEIVHKVDVSNLKLVNIRVVVKHPDIGQTSKIVIIQVVNGSEWFSQFYLNLTCMFDFQITCAHVCE